MPDIHEIRVKRTYDDAQGASIARTAAEIADIEPPTTSMIYYVDGITENEARHLAEDLLVNPVTQTYSVEPRNNWDDPRVVEVTDRTGMINSTIDTIATAAGRLDVPIGHLAIGIGTDFTSDTPVGIVERITTEQLVNREIQEVRREAPTSLEIKDRSHPLRHIPIGPMNDGELQDLETENEFGLSLEKLRRAQQESLRENGGKIPEGSLRILGPYWSDHCRHETFNADLMVDGKKEPSLYSMIKGEPGDLYEEQGVIQAFDGNSAVFKWFTDKKGKAWALNIKGETHNYPTMIEAYGGVATGVGGLLRDIVMTGRGAKPIGQLVSLGIGRRNLTRDELPTSRLQTPRQLLHRAVEAVSRYGNCVGVPTFEMMLHHHPGYEGKPMFLGIAFGAMPEANAAEISPRPGDILCAVGGKTGTDGVGGATGSSGASDSGALASTSEVQTPNPYEEKKMFDAILEASEAGLIRGMTDCGAGGIGLAAGELGENTGVIWDVSKLPLKAARFDAAKIIISESQERGVIAVAPENLEALMAIFAKYDSTATPIGEFGHGGDNPRYTIVDGDELVSDWSYEFLKKGAPKLTYEAKYVPPEIEERVPDIESVSQALHTMLRHDEICSTEPIVRQFDHEVLGMNVLKPFTGVHMDAPNYAYVLAPIIEENAGVVIAQSSHPRLTDLNPVSGTEWVVEDMVARIVSVGGDPTSIKPNNNYVAPQPTPHVMGALRLSVKALNGKLRGIGTKIFTGKDSCGAQLKVGERIIKNPYNLTLGGASPIDDVRETVSADIKKTNSTLVLIGNLNTSAMGGSILYDAFDGSSATVPRSNKGMSDLEYYNRVHDVVNPNNVLSCGVVSKGGLGVTLSKMLFGGDCGATINVAEEAPVEHTLFNETPGCFVVEVEQDTDVETLFAGLPYQVLGHTTPTKQLSIRAAGTGQIALEESIDDLKAIWKAPNEREFA